MRQFISEPDEEPRASSLLRHRLILLVVVVVGLSLGYLGRIFFPAPVDVAQQHLTEIERLHDSAFESYQKSLARLAAGECTADELANAIEQTPLSLWSDAETKLEELKSLGMKGDVFDLVCRKIRGCRRSAELLVLAIRRHDNALQSESQAAWREAKAAATELSSLRQRYAAVEPSSR